MIYIGIDPGKDGGLAIMAHKNDMVIHAYAWDDLLFVQQMRLIQKMYPIPEGNVIAAVEKVGAMPGQGVTSMFNFGKSAGFIEGVLAALLIPYQLIAPKRWKAEFGLNSDKQHSIDVCKRLFPDLRLLRNERCRKESDGMAEAALLAEFARRKL